ncbi:MAG: D-Ala-D-Ala carboxypeptidase family metallohydrolase [Desulfovibrionaceae bacterium]
MSGRVQLSEHFFLDEFTRSATAARLGRPVEVAPDSAVFLNLQHLCFVLLEPVRQALGPVHITSGYRPEWLNALVGGSPRSDHCRGLAADFVVPGMTPLAACQAVSRMNLGYRQLIHEFGRWVHVSSPGPGAAPQRQDLTALHTGGRTRYLGGLVPVPEAGEAA